MGGDQQSLLWILASLTRCSTLGEGYSRRTFWELTATKNYRSGLKPAETWPRSLGLASWTPDARLRLQHAPSGVHEAMSGIEFVFSSSRREEIEQLPMTDLARTKANAIWMDPRGRSVRLSRAPSLELDFCKKWKLLAKTIQLANVGLARGGQDQGKAPVREPHLPCGHWAPVLECSSR